MTIPYYQQTTEYTCGAVVMRMTLGAFGIHKTERQMERLLGTSRRYGTPNRAFPAFAERLGFSYVVLRHATVNDLRTLLKQKFIVNVMYIDPTEKLPHHSLVKRISASRISLLDPKFGPDQSYSLPEFQTCWYEYPKDSERGWVFGMKRPA